MARREQLGRRGQPGEPGADDDDVDRLRALRSAPRRPRRGIRRRGDGREHERSDPGGDRVTT
jgi:hypothetical protein